MADMNIQERYADICRISGLSEEIVRRVFRAAKQSLAESLKRGSRATLPGICTISPEIKYRVQIGGDSVKPCIKLKAKASDAMESEIIRISQFKVQDDCIDDQVEQERGLSRLNFVDTDYNREPDIRVNQISALL